LAAGTGLDALGAGAKAGTRSCSRILNSCPAAGAAATSSASAAHRATRRERPKARKSAVRQREHPYGRAAVRRARELRHERSEAARGKAAFADDDRDVLLAVHRVADRARARHSVEPRLPEHVAVARVVRAEIPV